MGLFTRKPSLPSTGHPGDDQLLVEIAKQSDLASPRHWVHYLYVAGEAAARSAADVIERAGWSLARVDVAADGNGWVVIAEKHDAVLTPEAVTSARLFFEDLAASSPGGDYDGWEASV